MKTPISLIRPGVMVIEGIVQSTVKNCARWVVRPFVAENDTDGLLSWMKFVNVYQSSIFQPNATNDFAALGEILLRDEGENSVFKRRNRLAVINWIRTMPETSVKPETLIER
jgi:hypothetical protein